MFSSLKKIREEAGVIFHEYDAPLYDSSRDEPVSGDGSTTTFYVEHYPLVDKDGDSNIDTDDVTVYVDGSAVTVSSMDSSAGTVTLASAPASSDRLGIDYAWSAFTDSAVTDMQTEANAVVIGLVGTIYTLPVDSASVNANFSGSAGESILARIEKLLAAAYLIMSLDPEEDSPQWEKGQMKLEKGMGMLKSMQKRRLILVDTDENELSRISTMSPTGYPNSNTTPTDEKPIFDIADQL